jgi:hypothetical protein
MHTKAVRSRNEMLLAPAKLVDSGCRKTLKLAVLEKWEAAISQAYQRLQYSLAQTALQLDVS